MSSFEKHILFITSSRIGDAVLSTGVLNYLHQAYPDAKFTIACGPLVVSLFEGFPNVDHIIPLKKQKYSKHWFDLWKRVVGTRFDIVIDLRNSIVSRALFAKKRYIMGGHIDKSLHKVQQNAAVLREDGAVELRLWFSTEQKEKAGALIPEVRNGILAVGPTANWVGKTWPAERFVEMIEWMTCDQGVMAGASVAVFAAPGEEDVALQVLDTLPEERRINVIAKTDPGTAAAALARCDFYLGNDSGLMHCAAAAGVPTFGVFGPSYPHVYRPWGKRAAYASTSESFDELIDFDGYTPQTVGCLMETLSVDMVKIGIEKSWPKMKASF